MNQKPHASMLTESNSFYSYPALHPSLSPSHIQTRTAKTNTNLCFAGFYGNIASRTACRCFFFDGNTSGSFARHHPIF